MPRKKTAEKNDVVANWKDKLPTCFGSENHRFAGNALEENDAFELLAELRKEGIAWRDVRTGIKEFLASQGNGTKQMEKQMDRVKKHFRPWLS